MGCKGKWFVGAKKASSPESKKTKAQKSKKQWGLCKCIWSDSSVSEPSEDNTSINNAAVPPPPCASDILPSPPLPQEEVKAVVEVEDEQSKHALSVALATAVAAEAAVVAAQAAAEVVRLTASARFSNSRSKEEVAAIKIQTAFRGYLARRACRDLKGLIRLKSLMEGNAVKRQTANALRSMQTLARVQSQIRSRRLRMYEENQSFQMQLRLKHERELEKLKMEEWDDSLQSKEKIDESTLHKQEAAVRRERALAYAFSHQWRNSSRSVNLMFMDPTNPQWGWSWMERWMAARPWEGRSTTDRELNKDKASIKSSSRSVGGEILKAYARRDTSSPVSQKSSRPPSRLSPSTPPSKAPSVVGKVMSRSPSGIPPGDDDARSMLSFQSERPRRHSLAGSSVRDDESLGSSPAIPSYMASTESARAKSRFQSPLNDKIDTPERVSPRSVKKRLSFPVGEKHGVSSPAQVRRHSGPPKLNVASLKEVAVDSTHNAGNEGSEQHV